MQRLGIWSSSPPIRLRNARLLSIAVLALPLLSCGEENAYVPPPPPKVMVAAPIRKTVTHYLEATGNAAAINTADLVARVSGFIQGIEYKDGAQVKAGTPLFTIEPEPYRLAVQSADASKASADANYVQQEANYKRQASLQGQSFASQATLDQALASRDAAIAAQQQAQASIAQAQLNLGYTSVKAPFDGIVTARQVSLGDFVGSGTQTQLATIVQLDPIYVNFNVSETDVLNVRANMKRRGLTIADIRKVPVEIGLQNEDGYPRRAVLDYIAPSLTANTGTLAVRAILDNPGNAILPGYFARIRIPLLEDPDSLLVPQTAVGTDQGGSYLLLVGPDNIVQQRKVTTGQIVDGMRVIASGLKPDDKVVIDGILRAVPGQKVDPQPAPAAATEAAQP